MNDAAPAPEESKRSYWGGIGLAFVALLFMPWIFGVVLRLAAAVVHLIPGLHGLSWIFDGLPLLGVAAVGAVQWLWLVPLSRWLRDFGRPEMAKGVISGGWMIVLLNASCWGLAGLTIFFLR